MSVLERELSAASKRCGFVLAVTVSSEEHLLRLVMKILVPIKFSGKTHMANVVCNSPTWPIKELPKVLL